MVVFQNLREWLNEIEKLNELSITTEVGLDEVGAVAEVSASKEKGKAVLLGGFRGYDPGRRILLNPYGTEKRLALTFGLPMQIDNKYDLLQAFKEKLSRIAPIPYEYVKTGPIMNNIQKGDEIDLLGFPAPKWHVHDGGPYIGTGSLVITRDPEENWINAGTYRSQLFDGKTVGFSSSRGRHGIMHRDKYFAKDQPWPVVMVWGCDPLLLAAGFTELPWGLCEIDWVGGWRGEPVKVIKGPLTGLPIPAEAEIAVEGFAYPGKVREEGPFGEWMGYYVKEKRLESCIEIQGVYFRDDPILVGVPPERPPYDADKCRQYIKSALLTQELKRQGIPGVVNAWCYGIGGCRLLVAVAIQQQYSGHARQVGHATYTSTAANYLGRYVIVVDEDVDPTDINDVMWAVITRSDPASSIDIIPRATSTALDPRISPEDKKAGKLFNSRAIIDATKPYEWRAEFPINLQSDIEVRRRNDQKYDFLFNLQHR